MYVPPYEKPRDWEKLVPELKEELAAIEHERWSDWQKYLHSKCAKDYTENGIFYSIPGELYDQWERQIATTYEHLDAREKSEDMKQVDRYWQLIDTFIRTIEDQAYARGMADMKEKAIELAKSNVKGTFTDDGGHDCWYIDELLTNLNNI